MSYTEVSEEGCLSRLGKSVLGVPVGMLIFVLAVPLLLWNECNVVEVAEGLEEGRGSVVTVDSQKVDAGNEGKLIHTTGVVESKQTLEDRALGIKTDGLRLEREVKIFQWKQKEDTRTEKKVGGGRRKVTTYHCELEWVDRPIDSSRFKDPECKGLNRGRMSLKDATFAVDNAKLGAFALTPQQIKTKTLGEKRNYQASPQELQRARVKGMRIVEGGFYIGRGDPSAPEVGDQRIMVKVVPTGATVTAVGKQAGQQIVGYKTKQDTEILMFDLGAKDADAMFSQAEASNAAINWFLRVLGFLMLFFGALLVLKPLSAVADIVPFMGSIVGLSSALLSFLVAAPVAMFTIAVGWVVARPCLGISLLLIGGVFTFFLVRMLWKNRKG